MELFPIGTQNVWVHEVTDDCNTYGCVIHNPTDHCMREFPLLWRDDRKLMERVCNHGVGHPDPDDIAFKRRIKGEKFAYYEIVHGCCGCCDGINYNPNKYDPTEDDEEAVVRIKNWIGV